MSALSDERIGELLDRLVPARDEASRWQTVVTQADAARSFKRGDGRRRNLRRPRIAAVATAAFLIVVVAPLSALAVTQGWWFFRFGNSPKPIGSVVVVAERTFGGIPWTFTAYRSSTDGLCFAATPNTTTPAAKRAVTGAMSCDEISGVPKTPQTKPSSPHGVSYLLENGNKRFPGVVFGPVIPQAATVNVRFASNQTIHATTIPAPGALGANVRFYIAALPSTLHWNPFVLTPVRSIVGRDRHGHVVARLVLPGRQLNSALFRISNQGKLVHLTPSQKHVLRSEHRGTLIYLMATRDGESFYRLGGNHVSRGVAHVCYGFGKPQIPYLLPASRRGIAPLVGVIGCTEKTAATFPSPFAPVWDLSIYGATRSHPQVVLQRLAGFASDAVKTVNLLDRKGRVVERVPVIDNVYAVKHVPPGIVAVVPTSFDGQSLARCGPQHGIRGNGTYLRAHC